MSTSTAEKTVTASVDAILSYASLSQLGRDFMAAVPTFDFFDDGIVEGSGNWGSHMVGQFAVEEPTEGQYNKLQVSGAMSTLARNGLWTKSPLQSTGGTKTVTRKFKEDQPYTEDVTAEDGTVTQVEKTKKVTVEREVQVSAGGKDTWWELTELGAQVVLLAATVAGEDLGRHAG